MRALLSDVKWSLRSFGRAPGVGLGVILTLALGIGASTVVFTLVDGLVLRPFPFPDVDRLIGVGSALPRAGRPLTYFEALSPAEYLDIRQRSRSLERVVAWDMGNRQVTFGDVTENLLSAFWWGDALRTLEVDAEAGRGFTEAETVGGDRVAMLSHRVWQTRFGGDRGLVGGAILVNGEPYTVVGIMPAGTLLYGTDLWLPMGVGPEVFPRERRQWQVLGRLVPGATLESVRAELDLLAGQVAAEHRAAHPEYEGWSLAASTWNDVNVRTLRPVALALMAGVAFVLLLVCVNVANLLLARSSGRRREFAVRAALGAGRARLLRQLLVESLLLALAGAVAGVLLGLLGVRGAVAALSAIGGFIAPESLAVSGRVLAVTAGIAIAAGLAFGLAPALHAVRRDLRGVLHSESRSTAGASRLRLQRAFVGLEIALALILLAGGGLLAHSMVRLGRVDPGFDPDDVLTMRLTLARERYSEAQVEPFFRALLERVRTVPGVVAAATTTQFPPRGFMRNEFTIEGRAATDDAALPNALTTLVSPGYFETLGIPIVRGRPIVETDTRDTPLVAVIDEVTAARYFPAGDAIGSRVRVGGPDSDDPWFEIVGIAAATRNLGLDVPPEPELYASSRQFTGANNQFFVVIRTDADPASALPGVRDAIRSLDAQQPVYAIRTIRDAFALSAIDRRVSTFALTLFAVFAVLIAIVGIYGVIAYGAAQRTREIGVRLALGARAGEVRRLVIGQLAVPLAIGTLAGLAGALALGRALTGLLYDVAPNDPATLAAVVGVLLLAAVAAALVPAHRASRLDPVLALRSGDGG